MEAARLQEILEKHRMWVNNEPGGVQANIYDEDLSGTDLSKMCLKWVRFVKVDLSGANLTDSDLSFALVVESNLQGAILNGANLECATFIDSNLSEANLIRAELVFTDFTCAKLNGADIKNANMRGAHLSYVDLTNADLRCTNLVSTNLRSANLTGADLSCANLTKASLEGANLTNADLTNAVLRYVNLARTQLEGTIGLPQMACPETGSFIGYKAVRIGEVMWGIATLEIPADAKRSSATSKKCRCSKAKVLKIENVKGDIQFKTANSRYDRDFVYHVGETVEVPDFDDDRWNECSRGIHFFMFREDAVDWCIT